MIGRFKYVEAAPPGCVQVDMIVAADGTSCGTVHMPHVVRSDLVASWGDYAGESLLLPVALGLAVIVSATTGLDMVLVGDHEAWDPDWGHLVADDLRDAAAFPPAVLQ